MPSSGCSAFILSLHVYVCFVLVIITQSHIDPNDQQILYLSEDKPHIHASKHDVELSFLYWRINILKLFK